MQARTMGNPAKDRKRLRDVTARKNVNTRPVEGHDAGESVLQLVLIESVSDLPFH